jgi:hypothetical protein
MVGCSGDRDPIGVELSLRGGRVENQDGMIVEAYGMGMQIGANLVLDLIEQGVQGDALRERVKQRIKYQREQKRAGFEVGKERIEPPQQSRVPRLFLV